MLEPQLDVRAMRKPDKHPKIFQRFDALGVGESFVLINNHDPKHLREEFETDHPGEFGWVYLQRGPERWEIRISRLASTPLPGSCATRAKSRPGSSARTPQVLSGSFNRVDATWTPTSSICSPVRRSKRMPAPTSMSCGTSCTATAS
jgi:uncharacterized protein (DUF2249 family)